MSTQSFQVQVHISNLIREVKRQYPGISDKVARNIVEQRVRIRMTR